MASAMSASREAVGTRTEGGTEETAVDEGERGRQSFSLDERGFLRSRRESGTTSIHKIIM